jgi:hypothetical protein
LMWRRCPTQYSPFWGATGMGRQHTQKIEVVIC